MTVPMSAIRNIVIRQIKVYANEKGISLPELSPGIELSILGFDSLDFALISTRVDKELGVTPFVGGDTVMLLPQTISELVGVYEQAVGSS